MRDVKESIDTLDHGVYVRVEVKSGEDEELHIVIRNEDGTTRPLRFCETGVRLLMRQLTEALAD